jgi:hypothetical protein
MIINNALMPFALSSAGNMLGNFCTTVQTTVVCLNILFCLVKYNQ